MRPVDFVVAVAFGGLAAAIGCSSVPEPVKTYASQQLPPRGRSGGAYASLVPELRGEMVLQDATAACSVDIAGGTDQESSAACRCARSTQATWLANCATWIGETTSDAASGVSSTDASQGD